MPHSALSVVALLLLLTIGKAQEARLVGSSDPQEGRLEVYHNSAWGTVCADGFADAAAGVVCYMLGYGYGGRFVGQHYGAGDGPIWLDDVQCSGTESSIVDCRHNGWGSHNCSHREDVSVSCIAVRLVGGPSPHEGRLEVRYNGTWGTVCDDYFDNEAATVVCSMLGYGQGGVILDKLNYGAGSGPIWLDNVRCNGTEASIANCRHGDCSHGEDVKLSCEPGYTRDVLCNAVVKNIVNCTQNGWGSHNCDHSEDVSVSCIALRLAGGSSPREGRLEVYYNGTWGTVCQDDYFDDAAATVVCSMLGYVDGGVSIGNRYGAGSGPIWLVNVQCSGTETNIANCKYGLCSYGEFMSVECDPKLNFYECYIIDLKIFHDHTCMLNWPWGFMNLCDHDDDVSVSCISVRLAGGSSPRRGRLEVYHNGTWGTVCSNGFTDAAARVVCYSLGYGRIGRFLGNYYGSGNGTVWLDNVRCNGWEKNIAFCDFRGWGINSCSQHAYTSVSVSCITARLIGSRSPREGRLEVYHNGVWGSVCDNGFTDTAARVVCYSLGYGYVGRFIGNQYGSSSGKIWLDEVRCRGMETNIESCRHRHWGYHDCYQDVSVSCMTVRLVHGRSSREGCLEVYQDGAWEKVCRDHVNNTAAKDVCYELGYGYIGQFISLHYHGQAGPIWFDDVESNGMETNNYLQKDCSQGYVAVLCFNKVRLVEASGSKGRLEVYYNGTWGTVCAKGFTDAAATVVCYSLGYGHTGRVIGNNDGAGSGPIWLNNVRCSGWELHIMECPHSNWGRHNCLHNEDVSVSCIADSAKAVALVGGGSPRVGRLEVFHGSNWGTVCDDGFSDTTARVVCYSLGFQYVGRKVDINRYSVGNGLIWLNNVNCTGTEKHIGECSHGDWGIHNCTHQKDVAISCNSMLVTELRLVGGSNSKGRLEVFHKGVWATVCDDFFDITEAHVVCNMLGFWSGDKTDNRKYITSDGPIWIDDLRCSGNETDIAECSHNGWGVHNCQHREDVAVSCSGIDVRLNGGRDRREGRLEVFYNGSWGSVCSDGFNDAASRVVCNMLGFGDIGRPTRNSYGYGHRLKWLNSVWCMGTEVSMVDCRYDWSVTNCSGGEEQAVSCLPDDAVALVGGESPREGRLEIYHNGTWGTVCDDGFTDAAARVVCHALGFGYVGREEKKIEIYGVGEGQIWLDDVQCTGTESHVGECSHKGWGVHNCGHHEDVAVSCVGAIKSASSPMWIQTATALLLLLMLRRAFSRILAMRRLLHHSSSVDC